MVAGPRLRAAAGPAKPSTSQPGLSDSRRRDFRVIAKVGSIYASQPGSDRSDPGLELRGGRGTGDERSGEEA